MARQFARQLSSYMFLTSKNDDHILRFSNIVLT